MTSHKAAQSDHGSISVLKNQINRTITQAVRIDVVAAPRPDASPRPPRRALIDASFHSSIWLSGVSASSGVNWPRRSFASESCESRCVSKSLFLMTLVRIRVRACVYVRVSVWVRFRSSRFSKLTLSMPVSECSLFALSFCLIEVCALPHCLVSGFFYDFTLFEWISCFCCVILI